MTRLTSLVFAIAAACGSSSPPPAAPAPSGPTACPSDIATLVGKPCTTEKATCGADAAAKATGFSNVVTCENGAWRQVEVPPPPPPG